MSKKLKIRVKKPYIAYPGSTVQQNYAEDLTHGYLLWEIEEKNKFDVKFCELSNPCPFITIDWLGDVSSTIEFTKKNYPKGSRFRVHNKEQLSQREVIDITNELRNVMSATEVTFKTDQQVSRDVIISSGTTTVIKEDLRNVDVLVKLIKEYHHEATVSENVWEDVRDLVCGYISHLGNDDVIRNTKWSLRQLKFSNTFTYGEENIINFQNLNGIVGIFGKNRSGKSSIAGTLMYSLFNNTDRGSIKNLHVINARKPYCYARSIINVNGMDYVVERQTVKNESKKGKINASTALNVYKVDGDEAIDLAGEQRTDTEKIIRKLIGGPEDFLLTSLSSQRDLESFISHGSTKRRQILAKFLDLDIFDKMHDMAKVDLNATKAVLKTLPERNWGLLDEEAYSQLEKYDSLIEEKNLKLKENQDSLEHLRAALMQHKNFTPVSKLSVEAQKQKVNNLKNLVSDLIEKVDSNKSDTEKLKAKLDKISQLRVENDLPELKSRLEAFRNLESSLLSITHAYESELSLLKQQEKSLKLLVDIPCGDSFPTCKFIKDAFPLKERVEPQRLKVSQLLEKLNKINESLVVLKQENLLDKISKIEQLVSLQTKIQVDISTKHVELVKLETTLQAHQANLESAEAKLAEFESALKNEENEEVVSLRSKVDLLESENKKIDVEKMQFATERGRVQSLLDKHAHERSMREETLSKMRAFELISHAFSKKGIPSVIIASQLPIINAEIAKILHGIVEYSVEFETDDESDSTEIYLNYSDSRRIIELGSGMEKMIASVAIRAALINISSLPKTDMLILDEGFGSLDDEAVEMCNRLLESLKRYFKTIVVITHVEGIKDAAETIIELTKNEKDAKVTYV